MSTRNNHSEKSGLALAIAAGASVPAWAKKNQVPQRTARTWAKCPEVLELVQRIRSQALDRAIGRLSKNATAAADKIAELVNSAASQAVQLHAARAVLAELMAVSNYTALEGRLAEVEKRLRHVSRSPASGPEQDQAADPVRQPATGHSGEEDGSCPA
jgi:hypothetical protein